jgi:hypothetical protein
MTHGGSISEGMNGDSVWLCQLTVGGGSMLDARFSILDVGYWMQVSGLRLQVSRLIEKLAKETNRA